MNKKYQVCIDDNYNYMDQSARYTVGSYNSLDEALDKCKEITVKSLGHLCEKEITQEDLKAQWCMFGEDPFIRGGDGSVLFSARKFITADICKAVINSHSSIAKN